MRNFECEAILFDLDGVLVDSTLAVVSTWNKWAAANGMDPDHIMEVAHGRRSVETIQLVAPDLDAKAEAKELERMEMEDLEGVREVAGAHDLLSSLPTGRWGVVTSGTRNLAIRRTEHTGLLLPDILVSAEDVTSGKPAPEAYLKGAQFTGVPPEQRLVVEDAPSGISAAKSAGMTVVAIATTHRKEELTDADAVAQSLANIYFEVDSQSGSSGQTDKSRLRVWVE